MSEYAAAVRGFPSLTSKKKIPRAEKLKNGTRIIEFARLGHLQDKNFRYGKNYRT